MRWGTPKIRPNLHRARAKERPKENLALRDILNKTLNENKVLEIKKEEIKQTIPVKPQPREIRPAISLNELKVSKPNPVSRLQDRSASAEDMNKLKNLISEKETKEEKIREVPEDVLKKILE